MCHKLACISKAFVTTMAVIFSKVLMTFITFSYINEHDTLIIIHLYDFICMQILINEAFKCMLISVSNAVKDTQTYYMQTAFEACIPRYSQDHRVAHHLKKSQESLVQRSL